MCFLIDLSSKHWRGHKPVKHRPGFWLTIPPPPRKAKAEQKDQHQRNAHESHGGFGWFSQHWRLIWEETERTTMRTTLRTTVANKSSTAICRYYTAHCFFFFIACELYCVCFTDVNAESLVSYVLSYIQFHLGDPVSPGTQSRWLDARPRVGSQHTPPSHLVPSARCSKCNSVWFCRSHPGSAQWRGVQVGLCHFGARTQTLPPGRNSPRHSKESEECFGSGMAGRKVEQKGDLWRKSK